MMSFVELAGNRPEQEAQPIEQELYMGLWVWPREPGTLSQ